MLIGFLMRNEDDWKDWKRRLGNIDGMAPVTLLGEKQDSAGISAERASAIDEVESISEIDSDCDDEEDKGRLV